MRTREKKPQVSIIDTSAKYHASTPLSLPVMHRMAERQAMARERVTSTERPNQLPLDDALFLKRGYAGRCHGLTLGEASRHPQLSTAVPPSESSASSVSPPSPGAGVAGDGVSVGDGVPPGAASQQRRHRYISGWIVGYQ